MKTTTILFLSLLLAFGLSTFAQNNCLDFQESTEIVKTNNAINLSGNTLTLEAWINIRSFQSGGYPNYGISSICGIEEGDNMALLRITESSKFKFDGVFSLRNF